MERHINRKEKKRLKQLGKVGFLLSSNYAWFCFELAITFKTYIHSKKKKNSKYSHFCMTGAVNFTVSGFVIAFDIGHALTMN